MTTTDDDIAEAWAAVRDPQGPRFDLLAHADSAKALGSRLAEQVSDAGADAIVIWDDPQSAVLAHIVSRSLRCPVYRVLETEGKLDFIREPPPHGVALILDDVFDTPNSLTGLLGRARNSDVTVAAVAALLPSPATEALSRTEPGLRIAILGQSTTPQAPGAPTNG